MAISYPSLEILNEDQLVATAVSRVSGGLTEAIVNAQIAERREQLKLILAGGMPTPICPELTNANPSSPHTVLLEAFGWTLAQQARRFNLVPQQNFIAFANLFGITPRTATNATTILRFNVSPPVNTPVTIPQGTQVSAIADGVYVFATTAAITIAYGTAYGDVAAARTISGHVLLSAATLTKLIDTPAYVTTVTNQSAIDSGLEAESIDSVLSRVNRYQRRGQRIVSAKDLEDAILDESLQGNGIVRAFPFVQNGNFALQTTPLPGYTTVVVMTSNGGIIDAPTRRAIALITDTAVGNQFIYVADPSFVTFNVTVAVKLKTGSPELAVRAAIDLNLRNFYGASRAQFGRSILRAEIIAVIEGTEGVANIVAGTPNILASPLVDTALAEYQLPQVGTVTITVVT